MPQALTSNFAAKNRHKSLCHKGLRRVFIRGVQMFSIPLLGGMNEHSFSNGLIRNIYQPIPTTTIFTN
jgi:hypothetical protein